MNSPLTGVSLCRWWWWWSAAAAAAAAAAEWCCCCCCCCSWWILCSSSELCEEELGLSTSETPESAGLGGREPANKAIKKPSSFKKKGFSFNTRGGAKREEMHQRQTAAKKSPTFPKLFFSGIASSDPLLPLSFLSENGE